MAEKDSDSASVDASNGISVNYGNVNTVCDLNVHLKETKTPPFSWTICSVLEFVLHTGTAAVPVECS